MPLNFARLTPPLLRGLLTLYRIRGRMDLPASSKSRECSRAPKSHPDFAPRTSPPGAARDALAGAMLWYATPRDF
ncbi:hypothetical protein ACS3QZ_07705 [Shimia sp. W99]